MTTTHTHHGIVWLDMESPTEEEIAGLIKRYELHPLVGEELRNSSSLAKIDFYKDYLLVVLTVPVRIKSERGYYTIADRKINFVIGKSFLVTTRTDNVEQLEYFAKIFDANIILSKDEKIQHAGHLFYYMIKRIYAGMCQDLENIRDGLITAESHIFHGDESTMVRTLSGLSRELIDFKQTARVHRDIWDDLVTYADKDILFGHDFTSYIHDIQDEFNRIHEIIANAHELLADLRETNDSLLDTKQNEIIKTLTLVAFIFYPLTFIAAIFTIPSPYVPFLEHPSGWWGLLICMGLLTAGIWWYFKKKNWV